MEAMETIVAEKIQEQKTQVGELYERTFPRVASFISRMGGSFDDARDIFHDALIIYMEVNSQDRSRIRISEEAYILGIAKHLWTRRRTKEQRIVPLNDIEKEISLPDDYFPSLQKKRLLRILETAGKKCMELLHAFYYRQDKVKEIAVSLGYANDHSLSVQKYKCLDKIRNTIKEKSLSYEDFLE